MNEERIFEALELMRRENNQHFEAIDNRLDSMDKRFDSMDKRLDSMDKRFDSMDKRFDAMDERLDSMDKRFDAMDERFDSMDIKLMKTNMEIENNIKPALAVLAEGHKTLLETLAPKNRVDELEEEVKFLRGIVYRMNEDLEKLKKAQ